MTKIKYKIKPTWRETGMDYDGRPMLIAQTPSNILLRLKGTRQVLELPYSIAYLRAAQITCNLLQLERARNRKARKASGFVRRK